MGPLYQRQLAYNKPEVEHSHKAVRNRILILESNQMKPRENLESLDQT